MRWTLRIILWTPMALLLILVWGVHCAAELVAYGAERAGIWLDERL